MDKNEMLDLFIDYFLSSFTYTTSTGLWYKEILLEGVEFPLLLCKQVFKNEDGSTGILYLVCSDVSQTYDSE